ncbi:MAG: FAD-binding oxidoreductase [Candidatus Saccharibacteria bacterium]|nr:FAD-binding oxidoreductase [Candidatus Saccharibacteria bacterium]
MSRMTKYLNQIITGNVFDTPEILEKYSTDKSALKIMPKLVAFPESTADIQKILKFINQLALKNLKIETAVRGSGLDETGADLTTGLVISMEKLNKLEEFDGRERLVRVQAGITLKELNTALSVSGLTIPVKANENETIGSLIANCPTDDYGFKYNGIMRYIERAEIVLANGECIQTDRIGARTIAKKQAEKTLEGNIYSGLLNCAEKHATAIQNIKNAGFDSAGYPTITAAVKKDSIDLLPLMFTSEGTLGIISEVILHAEVIPSKPVHMITTFSSLKSALNFMNEALKLKPLELNIVDLRILKTAEEYGKNLSKVTRKLQSGYTVYVSFNDKALKANKKLRECAANVPTTSNCIVEDEKTTPIINEFKNSIESYLNMPSDGERFPLLSNFFVPKENFAKFLKELTVLEQKLRIEMPIFGSYATCNFSIRPKFKLDAQNAEKRIETFLRAGNLIIERNGGSLTGGSPEGRIKAIISNKTMPADQKALYKEIKNLFDPNGILNASIKLGADTSFTLKHLKTTKTPRRML